MTGKNFMALIRLPSCCPGSQVALVVWSVIMIQGEILGKGRQSGFAAAMHLGAILPSFIKKPGYTSRASRGSHGGKGCSTAI